MHTHTNKHTNLTPNAIHLSICLFDFLLLNPVYYLSQMTVFYIIAIIIMNQSSTK